MKRTQQTKYRPGTYDRYFTMDKAIFTVGSKHNSAQATSKTKGQEMENSFALPPANLARAQPQWETCQSSPSTEGCLLDSSDPSNPLAYDGVNCQLGNIPPYYVSLPSRPSVHTSN